MYKKEAFDLGLEFAETTDMLLPDDFSTEDWLMVPYIVNMAFACELFLKSLLSDGESEQKGHNLEKLFYKLPLKHQKAVLKHHYFKGEEEFEERLAVTGQVYHNWRYSYEHRNSISVDIVFLQRFTDVVQELAEKELLLTEFKAELEK